MVIKRDEGRTTPDEPVFYAPPPPRAPSSAPVPIIMGDIPTGPGGGRADVMEGNTPGTGAVDIFNQGNNPFLVRGSDYERLVILHRENIAAAEEAAKIATDNAVIARTRPC